MKKKLAVYPFSEDVLPLFRHCDKIKMYDLKYGILPMGWKNSIANQFVIIKEEDFVSHNKDCDADALLLCKTKHSDNENLQNRMVKLANMKEMEIIYDTSLEHIIANITNDTCPLGQCKIKPPKNNAEIFPINVPIIMIAGMGENCNKWELQLDLYSFFIKQGYNAKLISSNSLSDIMNMHVFPHDIDSKGLTFSQQVNSINSFVKEVELTEKPDVIIMGIPGGIVKYSGKIPNGYGYLPYLISNALTPDITILSLYCGEYEQKHTEDLKSIFQYRFGVNLGYYHMSNKTVNYDVETRELEYVNI